MNWNSWIRQTHRWLSIAFTVAVIVTFVALGQEQPGPEKAVPLVSYLPLPPLWVGVAYTARCNWLSWLIAKVNLPIA